LPARSLLLFVTDLAEHYSQVANYMRLIDMIPPSALPPKPRTAIDVPINVLARYVGKYDLPPSVALDAPGLSLEVTVKDGALYLKPGARPAARLWPETAIDFFVKDVDVQVTFTKDASGTVSGLVVHQFGENRAASKLP
jgi:serine-type D-Ala-D-Ala carboxypeptidase/endopeptidase